MKELVNKLKSLIHSFNNSLIAALWGEEDSNLRSRKTADLQSDPFGRSGISPVIIND